MIQITWLFILAGSTLKFHVNPIMINKAFSIYWSIHSSKNEMGWVQVNERYDECGDYKCLFSM